MKIPCIALAFALQIILGDYVVRQLIFLDSTPTLLEKLVYHLISLPPFLIAVILILEKIKFNRVVVYSSIFYVVTILLVLLFLNVPNSITHSSGISQSIGSYGFYQTGGSLGGFALIPQMLLTLVTIIILKRLK